MGKKKKKLKLRWDLRLVLLLGMCITALQHSFVASTIYFSLETWSISVL
jgi:hypothetical protein